MSRKRQLLILIIISFLFDFFQSSLSVKAEENYQNKEQLAQTLYWQGNFPDAIRLWKSLFIDKSLTKQQQAEIHFYLGAAYRQMGQPSSSIHHLKQTLDLYEQLGDQRVSQIQVELANLLNEIGHAREAITMGREVLEISERTGNVQLAPLALNAIATGFLLQGELDDAISTYLQAQKLAPIQTEVLFKINNNLGTALRRRQRFLTHQASLAKSEGYDEESSRLTLLAEQDQQEATTLLINNVALMESFNASDLTAIKTYLNAYQISSNHQYLVQAENRLSAIPSSRSKAEILMTLAQEKDDPLPYLEQANTIAKTHNDSRTQSFALGRIGLYYERQQQYPLALNFSQKAQLMAQVGNDYDSLYRWQWQSGRLYQILGQSENAKAAYRGAIASLQKLRHEIATANLDFQLDIIEEVQPIYRELLSLLLKESDVSKRNSTEIKLNHQQIREILEIRNQLVLSGLQGFFGDACLELQQARPKTEEQLSSGTAKIHYLLLKEDSYQILELPDGSFRVFSLAISKADLEAKLMKWREMLLTSRIPKAYEPLSKELYNILLERLIPFLPPKTKRLVFVGDGLLRNVPLAALMDKDKFLIQKYAIAYSLGLPIAVKQNNSKNSVAFGLSLGTEYFPPLPFVPQEITSVSDLLQGRKFLDNKFTKKNFSEQMQEKYGIVHIATHAMFAGSAQETYFQVFDSLIFLGELENLLRKSEELQLLFLSACKTAAGNERSVLGLAGVGARVGANVVASLWSVRDESTSYLVADFYSSLEGETSQVESLRQAQLNLLDSHPKFWASFILITQ
ncbi:hypothetical protein C7H19_15290 [Aphanothece hegewaldii CCALA 016]|uniref:CHAT domain-containing protein n=1 Tax=Aphanothece hegewaldii CCALA 016 TaxID=2107694 RepID=A0A2T1LVN9_9CHRO|nr:CHAT domain-containing protein [Aphanothece hegewaldii]PSF35787.1 hypothetical protein C7H19_15290 [Aphanothece hegewaldii CCALA 016]